jgi:threonine/homoserine/homoserine lactone efflux protein
VNSIVLQVLLYAFVAGASPVALGAALVVLGSRHGRWSGLAFAVGVVLGQAIVCAVAYALGTAALPVGQHAHDTARAIFELALGIALLVGGVYAWRQPPVRAPKPTSRSKAVFARLERLSLPALFLAGAALTLGPKRLTITLIVTASISAADLSGTEAVTLTLVYVVIATALVSVPVVLAIVFGPRAEAWMTDVQTWLTAHRRPLTYYPLTILGVLVTIDALVGLLT